MVHEESGIRLQWENPILKNNYYLPILYDFRYLVSLKNISKYLLYQDEQNIFSNFVQLIAELNEGHAHSRVPYPHDCLNDDDTWATCWTLEGHLISIAAKLSKGLKIQGEESASKAIHLLRNMLTIAFNYIAKSSEVETKSIDSHSFKQVKFQVSKDPIALSTPLHKTLAIFIDRVGH